MLVKRTYTLNTVRLLPDRLTVACQSRLPSDYVVTKAQNNLINQFSTKWSSSIDKYSPSLPIIVVFPLQCTTTALVPALTLTRHNLFDQFLPERFFINLTHCSGLFE